MPLAGKFVFAEELKILTDAEFLNKLSLNEVKTGGGL